MIRLVEMLAAGISDDSGNPLQNGLVYCYQAGTTTLTSLYQDYEQEEVHPNPLTLDANGRVTAYADGRVKLKFVSSAGTTIRTIDDVGIEDDDVAGSGVSDLAGSGLTSGVDGSLSVNVDGSTISITNDIISVPDRGITRAEIEEPGHQLSSSSGTFTTTSTTYVDVTNLSVTITTSGNPVLLMPVPTSTASSFSTASSTNGGFIKYVRDSTDITSDIQFSASNSAGLSLPPAGFAMVDTPAAGTYTYKIQAKAGTGVTVAVTQVKLFAIEF